MARFSSIALLALCFGAFANAKPVTEQFPMQEDIPVHTTESWDYSLCGNPTDPVQIKSIEVSPDPPKPGQNLTVTVKADVLERVEEGAVADVVVKLGLIKLLSKSFDICDEARKAEATVQCPIETGEYTVVQTVALPKEIPQAKFTVAVRAFTVDEDDLTCLDLHVNFMKKPFFKEFGW